MCHIIQKTPIAASTTFPIARADGAPEKPREGTIQERGTPHGIIRSETLFHSLTLYYPFFCEEAVRWKHIIYHQGHRDFQRGDYIESIFIHSNIVYITV